MWLLKAGGWFLIWVLRPFQEYFTYIEPIVHRRWAKTGEPGEKPPDHPQAELGFPTYDPSQARTTAVRNLMDQESTLLSTRLRGPVTGGCLIQFKYISLWISGQLSSGCLIQVGCLIEVTTNTGLTVYSTAWKIHSDQKILGSVVNVLNARDRIFSGVSGKS